MYCPPAFRENRPEVLRAAIRTHPLATLITSGSSGLIANVLPFTLLREGAGDVLRAHLAKANQQVFDLREQAPTLVLFQGPQAYVSPSWYPTKQEHGKVVPTWNYVIVQVAGASKIIDDKSWLLEQINELTDAQESKRSEPWQVSDAPEPFVEAQLNGIVGLEVPISRIEGKWKVSQNQPEQNQQGVITALRSEGFNALADEVAGRLKARAHARQG
jgi:transcriptional regulator